MQRVQLACGAVLLAGVLGVCDGLIGGTLVSPATDRPATGAIDTPLTPTVSVTVDESYTITGQRDLGIDRYGNRIDKAFGDYRVDPRGDLFERHSPSTAVPRLRDPST